MILTGLLLRVVYAYAAQTGTVDYPYLGIQFSVSDGWQGEESYEMFVMGSTTMSVLLAIMSNEVRSPE